MKIGLLVQNPSVGIPLLGPARIALHSMPSRKAGKFVDLLRRSASNLQKGKADSQIIIRKKPGRKPLYEVRLDSSHSGILRQKGSNIEVVSILSRN